MPGGAAGEVYIFQLIVVLLPGDDIAVDEGIIGPGGGIIGGRDEALIQLKIGSRCCLTTQQIKARAFELGFGLPFNLYARSIDQPFSYSQEADKQPCRG